MLLCDSQIRALCEDPTHVCTTALEGEEPFVEYAYKLGENNYARSDTGNSFPWYPVYGVYSETTKEQIQEFRKTTPPMISPFVPGQVRVNEATGDKIISYGTSSMGYDVRLGRKFKIFTNIFNALIDPLDMPKESYVDHEGDYVIIPPNSYVLGHTIETFNIPRHVTAICVGKSTYARAGCAINVTPIEAGFSGQVVIEVANLSPLPMKVYSGMGIAQFLFLSGWACKTSYADRDGKYQNQTGIQTALV